MNFGICSLSVIPCRKEQYSTSEMVTQLLFGETYTIIEDREDWIQITTNYDNYPCWISSKQHNRITTADYKSLVNNTLSSELVQVISNVSNNSVFPITVGASLQMIIYSLILILVVRFKPNGLFGKFKFQ